MDSLTVATTLSLVLAEGYKKKNKEEPQKKQKKTMKKYIKPAIVEVAIENENILAASGPLGKNVNPITGDEVGANGFDDLDWDEE